ncbi:MAG: hypothetical protein M1380_08230 [Chloroflexi bacterium]|nr:hypothetical protein [Chloroflexota bacterium]
MSQGMGPGGPTTRRETADKLKERYDWLQNFSDDELHQVTYCSSGETMSGEEVYFDISHPERGVIQGEPGGQIPEDCCYVPKSEVRQDLWDKLVGPFHH